MHFWNAMSEYITHSLFALDCRRLALRFGFGGARIAAAFEHETERLFLGARSSRGRWGSVPLARAVRDGAEPQARRDLGFLLGLRTHDAADRQFKPIYRTTDTGYLLTPERDGPSRISVAQDVYLLRRFGRASDGGPFPDDLLEAGDGGADDLLTDVSADGIARDLLALGWPISPGNAELSFAERETFYVSRARYLAMWAADPAAVEARVRGEWLYRAESPLVRVAERLRAGAPVDDGSYASAAARLPESCHYARALARLKGDMEALAAFLDGTIDEDALAQAFQTEVNHVPDHYEDALGDARAEDALRASWHATGGL